VRRRSNLLILLGVAFFVVGGLIVYLLTDDDGDSGSGGGSNQATVVVGTDDIQPGDLVDELLEAGRLRTVEIPAEQVVAGAVQSVNQLAGGVFIQGFAADQQITTGGVQVQSRSFEIPEGHDAVAVQLGFVDGGAGYVGPGDRINLYGLYPTGTAGEAPTPRAELLLSGVEVLDVDLSIPARRGSGQVSNDPTTTGQTRASAQNVTFLLALTPEDAEKVLYSTEFASLYATLQAPDAPETGDTPGRDGGSVLAR